MFDFLQSPISISFFQSIRAVEITIRRFEAGTLERGRWQHGEVDTEIAYSAYVQPATIEDLKKKTEFLPEGERTKGAIRIWYPHSNPAPRFSDPGSSLNADQVVYNNETYEVQQVSEWVDGDVAHWDFIAVRLEEDL
ncbi:MAG: hypothetical protein M0Q12_00110 [Synergistaceae bacterium]|jgi:hypothetical protein|nr:hypothetical protein [Synergistaceae bacterium]